MDVDLWPMDLPALAATPGFPGVDYQPVWSADSRHIAWVTEAGDLEIASLTSGQKLFRSAVEPEGAP